MYSSKCSLLRAHTHTHLQHSEHSSSESGSRNGSRSGSRCSTHSSSDSYDVLRMSTLFVHSVSPGGPAEIGGLQNGTN